MSPISAAGTTRYWSPGCAKPPRSLSHAASASSARPSDAEAIARGNSRTRPELRDTVWVARGARDLGLVIAHELAHVLMDSGEHTEESGNLMREDTSPQHRRV